MINFGNRLESLKNRRQGTRERALFDRNLSSFSLADPRIKEQYEELAESPAIKYAIGAMAAVSASSTKISVEEGERVADTLIASLAQVGIRTSKEIQGSVALDVHIEGHSDVDMLIIKEGIVLFATPKVDGSECVSSDPRTMVNIIKELRMESETKLTSRYHAADVDCSGHKSISLSGGSLRRKIDIVPACWYYSKTYQRSYEKHDKAVEIYHKGQHELIGNSPFLHKKKVDDKDLVYAGNLKKVIRLMKNVVADMPDYKKRTAKKLSSYDLTAIGYHMEAQLECPSYLSLTLVDRLRSYLLLLSTSKSQRDRLVVPDGSRRIFNDENKVEALNILYSEVNDLATAISNDLVPSSFNVYDSKFLTEKHVFM